MWHEANRLSFTHLHGYMSYRLFFFSFKISKVCVAIAMSRKGGSLEPLNYILSVTWPCLLYVLHDVFNSPPCLHSWSMGPTIVIKKSLDGSHSIFQMELVCKCILSRCCTRLFVFILVGGELPIWKLLPLSNICLHGRGWFFCGWNCLQGTNKKYCLFMYNK